MVFKNIKNLIKLITNYLSIKMSKVSYWEITLSNKESIYCSVYHGKIYISLEEYRLMESDEIGRIILKDLKEEQVPIKVVV